jgi:hypothetical protein
MIPFVPLRSLLAAALLLAAPAQLMAATPVVNSGAEAAILKPLTLLKTEDLDFGTLYPSAAAGTATVNPFTGAVTTAGGVTFALGATTAAAFITTGTRRTPVLIRLPNAPVTLTRSGGTETMTVSNFTTDGNTTRQIDAFEVLEFKVGGRLNVAANQADGVYVGTFDVTVIYP